MLFKQTVRYEDLSVEFLEEKSKRLMAPFPTEKTGQGYIFVSSNLVIDKLNEEVEWNHEVTHIQQTQNLVTVSIKLFIYGKLMASGTASCQLKGDSMDENAVKIAEKDAIRSACGMMGMPVTKYNISKNTMPYTQPYNGGGNNYTQQQGNYPQQQQQHYTQQNGYNQQPQQQGYNNQYQNQQQYNQQQQQQGGQQSPFPKTKDMVANCQSCNSPVSGQTADYSFRTKNGNVFCQPCQKKH